MKHQKKQIPNTSARGNELPIPDELHRALAIAANNSSYAGEASLSLRRKSGLDNLRKARSGVRYIGPLPRPSAEEEEQWIADVLYAEKLEERARRNQG